MAAAIGLRDDYDAGALRAAAKRSKDGPQARRQLALAAIYDGATRTEAAKIGGVGLQVVRDWVMKFNADGPEGLIDRKAPGQPLAVERRASRGAGRNPRETADPAVHGVVRWRIVDLCQWIFEEFRVAVSQQTSAARCARWVIASFSASPPPSCPGLPVLSRILKSPPHTPGRNWARKGRRSRCDRGLVRRRGADRPEEQDHPPLGQARLAPQRPERSANRLGLHFRRDLSEGRQLGARARHASMRHRGDEPAPCRDRHANRSGRTRRDPRRSGRDGISSGGLNVPSNITLIALPAKCPELDPKKTSGSSCAKIGSRTGSSNPSTTSSITAATPGTSSSTSLGGSCPSECLRIGPTGSNQRVLVLVA